MATQVKTFKEVFKKNKIDKLFFCYITGYDIEELENFLNKDEEDNIPEYFAQALIHYIDNKKIMDEREFIYKAQKAGFDIIEDNGIKKVKINLQKPITLKEDFELPSEFNHLVYYTCES